MLKAAQSGLGVLVSKTILRNLIFLIMMGTVLTIFSSRDSLAGITAIIIGNLPCTDIQINTKASCTAVALCTYPGDNRTAIWNYLYNDRWCLYDASINTVWMHGDIGSNSLDAYTTSYSALQGWLLSIGENSAGCNGFDHYFAIKVSDCPSYSGVLNAFLPDPYYYPYPDLGDGCNYCEYNWMWDAQCHNAFDRVCPL